jgi:predicted DNA-binding protein
MTTISCKIPERLDARLDAVARRRRLTKSEIVRQALERHLRQSRERSAPRAFDLVKRLAGCLHGPRDLSANPRHLEDLGA